MTTLYTAHAISTSGRDGSVRTDDNAISVKLSPPGSNTPGTTNPEQLFASGYSACFGSAVAAVAKKSNVAVSNVQVEADVSLNKDDSGFFLSAKLTVTLPGVDKATAEKIVNDAHQMCPYSKATRGNIDVTLAVK